MGDASEEPVDADELADWTASLQDLIARRGSGSAARLLDRLRRDLAAPAVGAGAYVNTVPAEAEAPLPGDTTVARRLEALVRWNAMAMVVRGNTELEGIGGPAARNAQPAPRGSRGVPTVGASRPRDDCRAGAGAAQVA